jgi:hypothetical protein
MTEKTTTYNGRNYYDESLTAVVRENSADIEIVFSVDQVDQRRSKFSAERNTAEAQFMAHELARKFVRQYH